MADVLVVGAGIVGCAAGEALARAGAQVHFLDPAGVGQGATQASAGMLVPYSEGRHSAALEDLGARSLELWDDYAGRLAGRAVSQVYARTGSLEVALDEDEAAELAQRAADHAVRGIASSYLSGAAARQLEQDVAPDCAAALMIPSHGWVNAAAVTAALWHASEALGARLTRTAVQRIAPTPGGGISVETDTGVLTAAAVVLAPGSWAGRIAVSGVESLPIRPVRGQLLHLHWSGPPLARIVWGTRCYAVPWPDGTVLVGATLEDVGFDARATVAGVRDLLESVCDLVPRAWQAAFTAARAGLRPGSPDFLPLVGRSVRVPGLVYATGHYRNGVLLAPLTGELVARILAGKQSDPALDALDAQRFGEC